MNSGKRTPDARVARSRAALVGAFSRLLLERGYDALTPTSIADSAGVARSTFYEHFAGKPDLLRHSVEPIFGAIAKAGFAEEVASPGLVQVVEHFWAQRSIARLLLTGRPRLILQKQLVDMIGKEMRAKMYAATIPTGIVATQIAHAQIAVLDEWLAGAHRCGAGTIERILREAAASMLATFRCTPATGAT